MKKSSMPKIMRTRSSTPFFCYPYGFTGYFGFARRLVEHENKFRLRKKSFIRILAQHISHFALICIALQYGYASLAYYIDCRASVIDS